MKIRPRKMINIITVFATAILIFGGALFCSSADDQKITVVTTIFPEYDWVQSILGDAKDNAEVIMLYDKGVDPHSFQPSAEDILKIASSDLFIYVGGESDKWVEDALKVTANDSMTVLKLMDVLNDNLKEEVITEGMQQENGMEEKETDEHVWLSIRNAEIICMSIEDAIETADPDNAEVYQKNLDEYILKLKELDEKFSAAVSAADKDTVVFGDRFPFVYLMDDYGIDYYAAFAGCSAETEANFETIIFLASKIDELGLDCILTIDGSDKRIAETVVNNTTDKDQEILTLDSMQSGASEDIENGVTYISVMESNLDILKKALGCTGE